MKKVIVGMSGGVDSSVAALLLKQKGYEVIGVNLRMWTDDCSSTSKCHDTIAIEDAKNVCKLLQIPFYTIDFRDVFKEKVIDYFACEYINGRTPNPCNTCNRYVKFEALLNQALTVFNADYIATGHYASVEYNKDTGRYYLKEAKNTSKDQTYALYNLTQEQLKHIIMPLGEYTKEDVREIAKKNNLVISDKPDSQEICFIPNNDYASYIEKNYKYKSKKGDFVDKDGNVLGTHKGIIHYTVGQRRGLGLSLKEPMYVSKLDVKNNKVILSKHEELYKNSLICTKVNYMAMADLKEERTILAKIRYSSRKEKCKLTLLENGNIKVTFDSPQRAITPGQSIVFYEDNIVLAGGTIL
ncbi:MAG: tRNA 2-thiouridine(34) synthase MnmA [Clostridia bacterium]|nr:tRNA 2-thiouridine(34) synthase MnmA [Clostridia bacterium]MDD4375614.1 tRNA 2-thiouridine(34) synthase MnmA [Clostridia bacterium]